MAWCHVAKTCQQIRFVEILFSLRWYVELIFQGRTLSLYSNSSVMYSEEEPTLQCRRQHCAPTHNHWSLVQGLLRESWIRGSPDSRTISFGRTVGLWRYKIEDFVSCPDRTLLGMEGKLGGRMYYFLSMQPTLYNPRPLRCLYKPEGLVCRGNHNHIC